MDASCLVGLCAAAAAEAASAVEQAASAPEPVDGRVELQTVATLFAVFVLLSQWLARRVMAAYRRKLVERMNSDAAGPGRQRVLDAGRLLAGIGRRRRAVLVLLSVIVVGYSMLATRLYRWETDEAKLASTLVTLFLFLSFCGPVVLLGVSAARFARHFWFWFGPAAFAAVMMQTVVAAGTERLLWSLGLVVGGTVAAVAVRQAVPAATWARLSAWVGRRHWILRLLGIGLLCFMVFFGLAALEGITGVDKFGWHLLGALCLASVAIWVCYAVMVDRVQRIVVPLLALSFGTVVAVAFATQAVGAGMGDPPPGDGWLLVLGALFGVAAAWAALGGIALAYERKLFSESQFQIWTWMLAVSGAMLTAEALLREDASVRDPLFRNLLLLTLAALAVHAVLARLLVRPLRTERRLLVLRVFAHDERHETILEDLEYGWRFIGPIVLIGAPDFASRTIDPGKAARFLQRLQVSDLFIDTVRDLERRLVAMDTLPDPDGRYRVNDLFCRNNTWQDAVRMLLASSEAILVDLREYSAERRGTTAELHMLVEHGALERTVLLVGPATRLEDVAAALRVGSVEQLRQRVQVFEESAAGRDGLVEALVRRMPAQPLPGLSLQVRSEPAAGAAAQSAEAALG